MLCQGRDRWQSSWLPDRSCFARIGTSGRFRDRQIVLCRDWNQWQFSWTSTKETSSIFRERRRVSLRRLRTSGTVRDSRSCYDTMGTSGRFLNINQMWRCYDGDQWQSSRTVGFCYKRLVDKIWAQSRTSRNRWLLFNKFVHILIDELFTTSRLILVASIWNISVQDISTPALRNSLMFQAKQVSLAVCQDFRISKDSSVSYERFCSSKRQ